MASVQGIGMFLADLHHFLALPLFSILDVVLCPRADFPFLVRAASRVLFGHSPTKCGDVCVSFQWNLSFVCGGCQRLSPLFPFPPGRAILFPPG